MNKLFLTVGTQIPFDRLVRSIERWVAANPGWEVFAQIGDSKLRPVGMEYHRFIELDEYQRRIEWCDLIVAHAGIGAILSALESAKPILIMPRRVALKEHRNDHQIATAERFAELGRVHVAMDEDEVPERMIEIQQTHASGATIGHHASAELIDAVRQFLFEEK